MKIALQYLGKYFLFNFKEDLSNSEVIEREGLKFLLLDNTFYIDTLKNKVKKEKTSQPYIYCIFNDVIYCFNSCYYPEDFSKIINEVVIEDIILNISSVAIECDYSSIDDTIVIEYFKELKEKVYNQRELERLEKEKLDNENKLKESIRKEELKSNAIKNALGKVLIGEKIDNEEFELLLKHFGIEVHMRTISWIRNKLRTITNNNYSYQGKSGSTKVFELYEKLIEKIELFEIKV